MCIFYCRRFKCVEDPKRLPGQPIPSPTSGQWPYAKDSSVTHNSDVEGKDHSLWFHVQCSHPTFPESDFGVAETSYMCSALLGNQKLGQIEEWFDEPCPSCNGLYNFSRITQSSPVRTFDASTFEPTQWRGVRAEERRVIQRYADRMVSLSAHYLSSLGDFAGANPQGPDMPEAMGDPFRSTTTGQIPKAVTLTRLRDALRELRCSLNADHPCGLILSRTMAPDLGPRILIEVPDNCRCLGTAPDGGSNTLNIAREARRLMAMHVFARIKSRCEEEQWSMDGLTEVVDEVRAIEGKRAAGFPLWRHAHPYQVLINGRALSRATLIVRRTDLLFFARELHANMAVQGLSYIDRNSSWEVWLCFLLAADSGITLRWARMILWRVLTKYWEGSLGFKPSSFDVGRRDFNLSPPHQLAWLSYHWSAKLGASRGIHNHDEDVARLIKGYVDGLRDQAYAVIAKEQDALAMLCQKYGKLGNTVRASPEELPAIVDKYDGDCQICAEPLADHHIKLPRQPRPCSDQGANHWFGHKCLLAWFESLDSRSAYTCPTCRRRLWGDLSADERATELAENDVEMEAYYGRDDSEEPE